MSLTAFVVRIETSSDEPHIGDREVKSFLENLSEQRAFRIDVGAARIDFSSIYLDENEGAIATEPDWGDPSICRTLVFDGWLENRDELIAELAINGANTASTDSQIVLKSIARWGEKAVHRLYGEYSFVCLTKTPRSDAPDVFAVRDKVGIRPLFYSEVNEKLAISNFLGALSVVPWIGSGINDGYAAEFLCAEVWSTRETLYRGVKRVCGGHFLLKVGRTSPAARRYWRPKNSTESNSAPDSITAMRRTLFQAVLGASRSIGPLGVQISGGIDSSSVACVVAELMAGRELRAPSTVGMSQIFPGYACDESDYIDQLERELPFPIRKLTPVYATRDQLISIVRRTRYPYYSYAATSSLMHDLEHVTRGGRVIIGGEGGDELLTLGREAWREMLCSIGYASYGWRRLNAFRRSLPVTASSLAHVRFLVEPFMSSAASLRLNRLRGRANAETSVLCRSDAKRLSFSRRLDQFRGYGRTLAVEIATSCTRNWAWELLHAQYFCRGVEHRNPLLSARVLEFTLTLAPQFLEDQPSSDRWLMTRAAGTRMPIAISGRRSKAEFSGVVLPRIREILQSSPQLLVREEIATLRINPINNIRLGVWQADSLLSMLLFDQVVLCDCQ